jgi:hypothetical protein
MSFPNSLTKNISSPSLQGTPSQITNINNNTLEDIKQKNSLKKIKEINEDDPEKDNDNEENEFDEIEEEESEHKEEAKEEEKNEDEALKDNQPEPKSKIQRLFIFLRTGFVWRPIPKIRTTVLCLEITGVIFVVIGIVIVILSNQIKEIEIRYDDRPECQIGSTCDINFSIEEEMSKDVYVYYRMKNFYQNHRRYIKSKSNKQLKGNWLEESDIDDDCDPIKLNKDLYEGITGLNKTVLDPEGVAHPCGLIAKSFFNDTFVLKKGDNDEIVIKEEGIAWSIDKKKFKNSPNRDKQWIDVESERFMVWMRPASLPDFRKPWGIIDKDLEKGNYVLTVTNNYQVKSFDGEKYFILSTVNALGGKNYFLAILYFVVGGISLVAGILFWIGYERFNKDNEKTQKKE